MGIYVQENINQILVPATGPWAGVKELKLNFVRHQSMVFMQFVGNLEEIETSTQNIVFQLPDGWVPLNDASGVFFAFDNNLFSLGSYSINSQNPEVFGLVPGQFVAGAFINAEGFSGTGSGGYPPQVLCYSLI